MGIGIGVGIGRRNLVAALSSGAAPPPLSSDYQVYYEATLNTLLSGSPATNYGKVGVWNPVAGSGSLVQATDANRLRLRMSGFGGTPVVYSSQDESSRTMADSVLVIDKQNCSVFALIELSALTAGGSNINQTIFSLPGGVGELQIRRVSNSYSFLAWIDGTGSYVSSLIPASSLNLLGVTLSAGAVVVHCNGESETLAAVALSAGTVTGFSINYGGLTTGYGEAWGYAALVIYDHALDAGELASVNAWGLARNAVYPTRSDTVQMLFTAGASRSIGYYAAGNIDHGRRLSLDAALRAFYKTGVGGQSTANASSRLSTVLGLQSSDYLNKPGDGLNRPTKNQVVVLEIPTADVTAGTAEATIIANMTTIRNGIRNSGYDLIVNALAPSSAWDAGQLTKMANINIAMAALDSRRYGDFIALPSELSDPLNTTYFNADGLHYTRAGFDILYDEVKPYTDSYFSRTITTLKGRWSLNGSSGLLDDSGYRRDLQVINSPTYTTGLNSRQALVCTSSGSNAAKSVFLGREYDTLPLTVVCWFNGKSAADNHILRKVSATGGSKNWYMFRQNSLGQLWCSMDDTVAIAKATDKSYAVDTWFGVAMVLDSTNGLRLYTTAAGGDPTTFALRDTQAWTGGAVIPNTGSGSGALRLGNTADGTVSDIWLQSPQIHFEALSLAQLQALVA